MNIQYPPPDFQLRSVPSGREIWDRVRRSWVRLTPEEWVRQNFVAYLQNVLQYPTTLMALEKEIFVNGLKKRCDILIYKNAVPWMIIECKKTEVLLNESVVMQALRYNMTLHVPYICITNGRETYAWSLEQGEWKELHTLPQWS